MVGFLLVCLEKQPNIIFTQKGETQACMFASFLMVLQGAPIL